MVAEKYQTAIPATRQAKQLAENVKDMERLPINALIAKAKVLLIYQALQSVKQGKSVVQSQSEPNNALNAKQVVTSN